MARLLAGPPIALPPQWHARISCRATGAAMPENQWSPDEARKHASAGGKAKAARARARAAMTAPERARKALTDATGQAAQALVDAALGRNGFEDLDAGEKLKAVLKVLEFGLGRPSQGPKPDEKPEHEEAGLALE